MPSDLSADQCILLTVHYASSANIAALHSFTHKHPEVLTPSLVLRILLTYLPESLEPKEYRTYIGEVASRLYLNINREDEVKIDISSVKDLDANTARRKAKKLNLLDLEAPAFPPEGPHDILSQFLCHRSYRIDSETGLLNFIPQLVEPFLDRDNALRTWYVGVALPLIRTKLEYYAGYETAEVSLADFEQFGGRDAVDFLLRPAATKELHTDAKPPEIARDIKGLVGPWMYGHTGRKRRKLNSKDETGNKSDIDNLDLGVRKISLSGVSKADATGHDWEHVYSWMVSQARENLSLVTRAIDDWDGPADIDLGGLNQGSSNRYLEDEIQKSLGSQYAQAAFAACYASHEDNEQTIENCHTILARLAMLLDFIPPPDLASSIDSLPKIERHSTRLEQSRTLDDLEPAVLLKADHPLTTPTFETYMLLQMMVYSAYQFASLEHPISLFNVVKLHFYTSPEEQRTVLQKILSRLSKSGTRRDEAHWISDREKLLWLWNWGIDADEPDRTNGAGVLGRIPKEHFEEDMLKCFIDTNCYNFAINLYVKPSIKIVSLAQVEEIVWLKAMDAYDSASNGNKTRGAMKRANDIVSTFRPFFPNSKRFPQAAALIQATHALSFYSLTLQHGVPFRPVSIRVSKDSLILLDKVLEQNSGSYTHLDDLIGIARNLVSAGLLTQAVNGEATANVDQEDEHRENAARRVTFMAIEAALREDDFETAYSYIVSRLTPSSANIEAPQRPQRKAQIPRRNASESRTPARSGGPVDDNSWRAAFLAGRYRPSASTPPTLRRLEQRTELLSLALLLAPVSALTEILAAWRRCEEEMTSLQLAQQQAEEDFDDQADRRQSTSTIPGNFTVQGEQPALVMNQKRREMGRLTTGRSGGGGGGGGGGEAPVSMFDLTRSAAQAISKNAFPLRDVGRSVSTYSGVDSSREYLLGTEDGSEGQQRVRKRDVVANAVSGGLASGLGWVLGATPQHTQQQEKY